MLFYRALLSTICVLSVTIGPSLAKAESVKILAAASLTDVVDALITDFSDQFPDSAIEPVFAGSGLLARQIKQNVPADIYLSANAHWVTWLADQGIGDTPIIVARNALVWIGRAPNPHDAALSGQGRIAIADPDAVPAGEYARQSLQMLGEWDAVQDRLILSTNVRDALGWVVRGHAPFAIVYATDAAAFPELFTSQIAPETHTPILYAALTLSPAGAAFTDYLLSQRAQDIFAAYGFGAPDLE